jgi:F-type H+-transporting ATPase subunit epsilon
MNTFKLIIASPNGNVLEGEAEMLSLRGIEGSLAVMAGHVPFITVIKPCEYRIELPDGEDRTGHTDGGILTVSKENVTFLSGRTEIQAI